MPAVGILCLTAFQKEYLPMFVLFIAMDLGHREINRGISRTVITLILTIVPPRRFYFFTVLQFHRFHQYRYFRPQEIWVVQAWS